jgi:NADP-dependent 3-hydroxy acid dehydrogenase YdfG
MTKQTMPPPKSDGELKGKVAVVTGAGSGIGLALALHAAGKGMKLALADIDRTALEEALSAVKAKGAEGIIVPTDVTQLADLQALRRQTVEHLGSPWLVANNAGITKIALTWNHTEADWKRMFDINVGGVVNGVLAFLPGLLEQGSGYMLNTASVAGLLCVPGSAAYVASKHAVVGLSETLYRELKAVGSGVGLSVLCPGLVKTNILRSRDGNGSASPAQPAEMNSAHALDPSDVAAQVFDAIAERRFWISTHAAEIAPYLRARLEQAVSQNNPNEHSIDPEAAKTTGRITGLDFMKSAARAAK